MNVWFDLCNIRSYFWFKFKLKIFFGSFSSYSSNRSFLVNRKFIYDSVFSIHVNKILKKQFVMCNLSIFLIFVMANTFLTNPRNFQMKIKKNNFVTRCWKYYKHNLTQSLRLFWSILWYYSSSNLLFHIRLWHQLVWNTNCSGILLQLLLV